MHETEQTYYKLLVQLGDKEQRFVSEYLISCNGAQAARQAGYSNHCAKEIGYELLTKPHIAEAIRAGLDMIAARCEVSAEKITRELAAVAFSNVSNYTIDNQGQVSIEEGALPEAFKAIQSVKRILRENGTVTTEYRLWHKLKALELLGKKLRLWIERIESEPPQNEAYRLLLKQLKEDQTQTK